MSRASGKKLQCKSAPDTTTAAGSARIIPRGRGWARGLGAAGAPCPICNAADAARVPEMPAASKLTW
jgi:hypothetical protein